MRHRAIMPGTFDPVTSGHLDIIERGSQLMDEVIVAVAASERKRPLFSLSERTALVAEACAHLANVEVRSFDGLLVDFTREVGANVIIKGLRAITDFEYEFQLTALNYQLDRNLETVFIMSPPHYMYLSSSIVREIASMHGSLDQFVPPCVSAALRRKFKAADSD